MAIPAEGDLSLEKALSIAREALAAYGVSPEAIDDTKVSVNFWHTSESHPALATYWTLAYYEPNATDNGSAVYLVNLNGENMPYMVHDVYQDGALSS